MKRINAGTFGSNTSGAHFSWEELNLDPLWRDVVRSFNVGSRPRAVQFEALATHGILSHRRNLLINAPTNSGKSLLGLLLLVEAIRKGRRAVLLEPLRAIAKEKTDELQMLQPHLSKVLGRAFGVHISTGDYRLEAESLASSPPMGEIIVATPERFEAITRNPDHDQWLNSIDAVCIDEAHLIGSEKRGATLEYLVTSLLCLPAPPRLALLSATLGSTDRARDWLSPCDVINVTGRHPLLHQEVWELASDEDANEVVCNYAEEVLQSDPRTSLLVFVYQTGSAERLADLLLRTLSEDPQSKSVLAYHAQMNQHQRQAVRDAFMRGECRCVVTTTALGLGVNLPASHVLVRDSTFMGVGPLSVAELIQMMGRAGRGDKTGRAAIIVRQGDGWRADDLANALREEKIPDFVSSFERQSWRRMSRAAVDKTGLVTIATHVASQLSRQFERGLSVAELQKFFERSLGGKTLARKVSASCAWLEEPARALVFVDEFNRYRLTKLGLAATRSVFPLNIAAGLGQLIRDLLSTDPTDGSLAKWRPLDHLTVLEVLSGNTPQLRSFSVRLVDQVDAWMEKSSEHVPMLYRDWIAGEEDNSRAIEVLGSLGIVNPAKDSAGSQWAYRACYLAMFRSIILFERGEGANTEDLSRCWDVKNLEGVEERWRDNLLWLLSGLAQILDVRCFYYHLNEECGASAERIQRVKRLFGNMRAQTFELQHQLKYCSPLGSLLHSLRRTRILTARPSVGLKSIKRLEDAGITNFADLAQLELADLVRLGIRRDFASQIRSYVRRRLT
jgi:helicase